MREPEASTPTAEPDPTAESGSATGSGGQTPDGSASDPADAALDADLHELQRERDELLDTSRRLQADFENYRKRMLRDQTVAVERASEGLVEQLLPVLDNFEMALLQLEADADVERIRKGVDLVYAELLGTLEKAGLERVDASGAPFDPNVHEAVLHDDSGSGEPVVGEVMRTGYRMKGRVLRPAMVKVTRDGEPGDEQPGA